MHTRSGRVVAVQSKDAGPRRFGTNLNNAQREKRGANKAMRKKKGLGRPSRTTKAPSKLDQVQITNNASVYVDEDLHELLEAPQEQDFGDLVEDLDMLDEEEENAAVMNMSLDETSIMEEARASLIDIDQYDMDDAQSVTEYVNDIYKHLRFKEMKFPIDAEYMTNGAQPDLSANMRKILLDWLFDVHSKFKLLNDTIWMTVDIVDRFLAVKEVSRRKLQLVGVTAMLIASKYEEIYAPEVRDFVYICDNAYSRAEILEMERMMLNTLNFEVCHPTSLHFLRRFSKAARSDSTGHTLSKYLLEVALQEYPMIRHKPSLLAAAAVLLGRNMMETGFRWGSTLKHYTMYRESQVIEVAREMAALIRKLQMGEEKCTAVYRKYTTRFFAVAKIPVVDI